MRHGTDLDVPARYVAEHAALILEAAAFQPQWDSTWAKLPEVSSAGRREMVEACMFSVALAFEDPVASNPSRPMPIALPPS
jgi:hypothetical protein